MKKRLLAILFMILGFLWIFFIPINIIVWILTGWNGMSYFFDKSEQ